VRGIGAHRGKSAADTARSRSRAPVPLVVGRRSRTVRMSRTGLDRAADRVTTLRASDCPRRPRQQLAVRTPTCRWRTSHRLSATVLGRVFGAESTATPGRVDRSRSGCPGSAACRAAIVCIDLCVVDHAVVGQDRPARDNPHRSGDETVAGCAQTLTPDWATDRRRVYRRGDVQRAGARRLELWKLPNTPSTAGSRPRRLERTACDHLLTTHLGGSAEATR
jgi:hypothetical protein